MCLSECWADLRIARVAVFTPIGPSTPVSDSFRARGGKIIVPQGASDPVFSLNDALSWYREVDKRTHRGARRFVRVFPVPGMSHCAGGPATDRYDALAAVVEWVERGIAPDRIIARASPTSLWPNRTRPLCAYPKVARYAGTGDVEDAANFRCE
jgi:hypothetical protein